MTQQMIYNYLGDKMKIIISMMLIVFPILMYLVFSCYNVLINRKIARIIFILTIFTSLYFSLRIKLDCKIVLLFCNIPILISYLKKEPLLGVILSIITIIFGYLKYDTNLCIIIGKHICYLIAYIFIYKKQYFNSLFFKLSTVIQGFFLSFEYFMNPNNSIDSIIVLIFYTLLIYIITFFCLYLFQLADSITKLYIDMSKFKEENKLKNSLFKLTHEIKNPLAVCKGYLDMMNLNDVPRTQKYLDIIKSEIARSLNIMNDFMDYSKIKINKEIFDMSLLLDELYDLFNILISDKNIKLNYINEYDELYVLGDYGRLKQVFVNIIKNSIEAISKNGKIDISTEVKQKELKISIKDNGIGMSNEEMANMSEMFYTTKRNGTGLGVSLSKEIILAHNGNINYKSVKNEGTECIVSLPL